MLLTAREKRGVTPLIQVHRQRSNTQRPTHEFEAALLGHVDLQPFGSERVVELVSLGEIAGQRVIGSLRTRHGARAFHYVRNWFALFENDGPAVFPRDRQQESLAPGVVAKASVGTRGEEYSPPAAVFHLDEVGVPGIGH